MSLTDAPRGSRTPVPKDVFVGRDGELRRLHELLERAYQGAGGVVF